ncbi:MAG: NAD+ synthase [Candidatus Eisenbacteria bacterium]|uniref:Glutamine-dependent NAD(+) synthetase n=1 Tax=Eiseniibacteriota bacterium TaxID=2212470 RepID=A0A849SSX1_UNCEI|nr:NAD+ synthase [Candidatus Eisenbacteria bacterium]
MSQLRLALAQLNPRVGAIDANAARVAECIEKARAQGVDVLAVPEMMIPGYPPEDLLLEPAFIARTIDATRELAPLTRGMTVIVGTLDRDADLFNAAAVLHDGAWAATFRKRYLPNYGVFDENRYFMPGREGSVLLRDGVRIGVSVCEDIWYPGGPVEEQVIRGGAELLVNLSASPYHAGKFDARRRMLATRAADNLAVVAYVNLVGGQDEIVFDGGSLVIDENGDVLVEGERFDEDFLVIDLELSGVFGSRLHDPRLRKERALDESTPLPVIELTAARSVAARPPLAKRAPVLVREPVAEIYDALVLGTRDYVLKNGFREVVLGLSGGADSALVACIAADAIGSTQVIGVAMPSSVTSRESQDDAATLARNLGMRLEVLPIGGLLDGYRASLATVFEGRAPDVTEENLQARIRGNLLMALSNKFGWLVLVTGNKSEIAVGYNTLYGDTAGGYAVLKDVYKTMVYQLSQYRNGRSGSPDIPLHTLTRAPSAELRPNQTDQDALPPYDVLDPILRLLVEEDRSIESIAKLGFDTALVAAVAQMIRSSEWKRRQMPPGVKISPRAFGKDWRRPITDGWQR